MSSLATLIRLQRHALAEKKKALAQLMDEAAALRDGLAALAAALAAEKALAATDPALARAFPDFLQAMLERRATLDRLLGEVMRRIAATEQEIAHAFAGLKAYELAEQSARERAAQAAARYEQKQMDEIGGRIGQSANRSA